jgi:hypothetical protein
MNTNQSPSPSGPTYTLRARVTEFRIPPVHDVLIVGREAPVGCEAMRRALALISHEPYEVLEPEDEVIGGILVRAILLRRLPPEKLRTFLLQHAKPVMQPRDVLHMNLEVEVHIEDTL